MAPFWSLFFPDRSDTLGHTSLVAPRWFRFAYDALAFFFFVSSPHGTANNRLLRTWQVHPNGRMNYRGKETRADGSDPLAETAARAAELVDRAAIVAEVCTVVCLLLLSVLTSSLVCTYTPGFARFTMTGDHS